MTNSPAPRDRGTPRGGLSDITEERALLHAGVTSVVGMDEVGRGCIAGPVGVGAVWCDLEALCAGGFPAGLRDSKKLSPRPRSLAAESVRATWEHAAVAYASPEEIDAMGISAALSLAGRRALAQLPAADLVMLDGKFNWLGLDPGLLGGDVSHVEVPPVRMYVGGDDQRIPIAAASLIAKVDRDAVMSSLDREHPGYGWANNVGYPSPAHKQAIADLGVTPWHRKSFRLGK